MSSSPSDAVAQTALMPAPSSSPSGNNAVGEALEIRQRRWIKRALPQTMFGRSVLLIVLPLVLVQIIATWVFYARHWETVSRRLSADTAGDIAMVIEGLRYCDTPAEITRWLENASRFTGIGFSVTPGAALRPAPGPAPAGGTAEHLRAAIVERVGRPYGLAPTGDGRDMRIELQLADGVLVADVPRSRVYTSTTYVFILWMIGSSLVLLAVAALFLRNQVKSLRRLAAAADGFGKGRPVAFTKLEGALEVRQAGAAFMQMRDRIQRQIRQRTEMLAGVSHDLRTPLTRMKLALAMMDGEAAAELKSDVVEMERLVNLYLDFARGEGTEAPVETDIALLVEEIAAAARRDGADLSIDAAGEVLLPLRPNAMRRCLGNLVANARRHGTHVWLATRPAEDGVDIVIDDDGPGIPPAERERAFQPFVRLDSSRNPSTGGVGLGLTIARDIARGHGGDLRLETSPHGGLRARIHLPW